MRNKLSSYLAFAAFCMVAARSPAFAKAAFGDFPIYPHATMMAGSGSAGVPTYESHDSVSTVDRWYRAKLPATCQRFVRTAEGQSAIQYICRLARSGVNVLDIIPQPGEVLITAQ